MLGLALFVAPTAFAGNNCSWNVLSLLGGSWNTPGNWTSCGGGIPGQNAGDTATITLGISITVDSPVPNPVGVTFNTVGLVTVTIQSGGSLILANGSASTLLGNAWVINGGTLSIASGSNLASYGAHVTLNSGAFNLLGSATLGTGYTQNGGTMTLGPGNFGATSIAINAGTVTGRGTLKGPVTLGQSSGSAAVLNPGSSSPGSITVNGNYTQLPTGVLNIDLDGTTPGTQYDQLIVTGTANLGGTLNATLGGGYTPADGDVFSV
ncbi:MAG TPA: hypothetical protein VL284_14255, partial [Thermoanaerobaculia bacterium]|nr:hypothetical protein [Thermoanaerobaculia bacterium]